MVTNFVKSCVGNFSNSEYFLSQNKKHWRVVCAPQKKKKKRKKERKKEKLIHSQHVLDTNAHTGETEKRLT